MQPLGGGANSSCGVCAVQRVVGLIPVCFLLSVAWASSGGQCRLSLARFYPENKTIDSIYTHSAVVLSDGKVGGVCFMYL